MNAQAILAAVAVIVGVLLVGVAVVLIAARFRTASSFEAKGPIGLWFKVTGRRPPAPQHETTGHDVALRALELIKEMRTTIQETHATVQVIDRSTNHRAEGTPTMSEDVMAMRELLAQNTDATNRAATGVEKVATDVTDLAGKFDRHVTDPGAHGR